MGRQSQGHQSADTIVAALEKASLAGGAECIRYDGREGIWSVPSSASTGELYFVSPSGVVAPQNNWWDRLTCTCKAAQTGYRVCWHKAAVWMHVKEAMDEYDRFYGND